MNNSQDSGIQIPSKYLSFIHVFRGFAILFIVCLHVTLSSLSDEMPIKNVLEVIFTNSTILFVFIAGFLFQHLNNDHFSFGNYLVKKLKYVVLPYIVVSIPVMIKKIYVDSTPDWWMDATYQSFNTLEKVGFMLVTGKQFGPF